MNDNGRPPLAPPRWSNDRVLFEVESHGASVPCSVSKAVIQNAGEGRSHLPRDVMLQFERLQDRITAAALAKLRTRSSPDGILHVWSSDLDDDPAPAVPAASLASMP